MTSVTLNGEAVAFRLDPQTPLLWALRDAANLTGVKYGCDTGDCGACSVLVDGQSAKSCQLLLSSLEGADIVTIEGLSSGRSHPVQQAWIEDGVTQCGYCEPGMVVAFAALLKANPKPGREAIDSIANICRCGIGPRLVRALSRVATSSVEGDNEQTATSQPPSGSSIAHQI